MYVVITFSMRENVHMCSDGHAILIKVEHGITVMNGHVEHSTIVVSVQCHDGVIIDVMGDI